MLPGDSVVNEVVQIQTDQVPGYQLRTGGMRRGVPQFSGASSIKEHKTSL